MECQTHPGKQKEFAGIGSRDPERVVCLSFWKTREEAEHYLRNYDSQIVNMLRTFSG